MTKQTPAADRWRDRPPGAATLEQRAASLMRAALPAQEGDDAVLDRVARRLARGPRQHLRSRVAFRLALGALCLVAGAASVKAYEWVRQKARAEHGVALPAPLPRTKSKPAARHQARAAEVAADEQAIPSERARAADEGPQPVRRMAAPPPATGRIAPAASTSASQVPAPNAPPIAPPALPPTADSEATSPPPLASPGWPRPAPPAASATASDEISALDRAMSMLRRDRNARGALAALDDYLRRYPGGILHREALSGRVDALLLLHRPEDALAALESFPFDDHRRSLELRVIRGELRARRDCTLAMADFDHVLGRALEGPLLERTLYGRGACRAKSGDQRGAASDFRRYVESFPEGSHAGWARRWLENNKLPP